uniref:Aryl-hydrocarbon-interacting protein-like 1 n=1 Tax=Sinocyclocheilus rhinocerous TaxID=307959 RepID=A0A673GVY1_9TELE
MQEAYLLGHPGVKKKILHGGQGPLPHFPKGTKLVFHFQTLLDNFERTVIDDSRKNKRPTEIFVGKMFKMEVWEVLLTSMRIGEVAEFWCDAIVGDPFSYQRESWMMEKDEKLKVVPSLHLLGNALVKQGRFHEAAEKYQEAKLIRNIQTSMSAPEFVFLPLFIIPLVLNYCQCMLELEEYYEVIEHTTELLDKHKDCVKAYYKRAKAYVAVWSEREARRDFQMVANLDITLSRLVQRELNLLSERMKEKYWEDKERYWKILEDREKEPEKEDISEMDAKEESRGEHSQSPEEVKDAEEGKNPSVAEENNNPALTKPYPSLCVFLRWNIKEKTGNL